MTVPTTSRIEWVRAGAVAAFGSALACGLLLVLAKAAGVGMVFAPRPGAVPQALPLEAVVVESVVAGIVATAVFAWMCARGAGARRRFVWLAAVVLAVSLVPVATMPADTATKGVLAAMHLVAAAFTTVALFRFGDPTSR